MLKINKKVEYALIALKYMAERPGGTLTSSREICDKFKTPFDTTAKVMQVMNSAGILNSTKGTKGGYSLNKNLKEVSFIDLAAMVEGKESLDQHFCQSTKGLCDLHDICNIVGPIEKLNKKMNGYLQALSLEDLLLDEQTNEQDYGR